MLLSCSKLGVEPPDKKLLISATASLGLCNGTRIDDRNILWSMHLF